MNTLEKFAENFQNGQWYGYEMLGTRHLICKSNVVEEHHLLTCMTKSELESVFTWIKDKFTFNVETQQCYEQKKNYTRFEIRDIIWKIMSSRGYTIMIRADIARRVSYADRLLSGQWCGYQNESDRKRRFFQQETLSSYVDTRIIKRGRIAETMHRSQLEELLKWAQEQLPSDHILHEEIQNRNNNTNRSELIDLIWRVMTVTGFIFYN